MWPAEFHDMYSNVSTLRCLHRIAHTCSQSHCWISPRVGLVQFPCDNSLGVSSKRRRPVASFSGVSCFLSSFNTWVCVTDFSTTFCRLVPLGSLNTASSDATCKWPKHPEHNIKNITCHKTYRHEHLDQCSQQLSPAHHKDRCVDNCCATPLSEHCCICVQSVALCQATTLRTCMYRLLEKQHATGKAKVLVTDHTLLELKFA